MQNPAVRPSVTCPPEIKLEAEKFEKHTAAAENISLNSELLLLLRARNATRSTAFGVISPRQTSGLSAAFTKEHTQNHDSRLCELFSSDANAMVDGVPMGLPRLKLPGWKIVAWANHVTKLTKLH